MAKQHETGSSESMQKYKWAILNSVPPMIYASQLVVNVQTHKYVSGHRTGHSKECEGTHPGSAEVAERRRCDDYGIRDVPQHVAGPDNQGSGVQEGFKEPTGESRYTNCVTA